MCNMSHLSSGESVIYTSTNHTCIACGSPVNFSGRAVYHGHAQYSGEKCHLFTPQTDCHCPGCGIRILRLYDFCGGSGFSFQLVRQFENSESRDEL